MDICLCYQPTKPLLCAHDYFHTNTRSSVYHNPLVSRPASTWGQLAINGEIQNRILHSFNRSILGDCLKLESISNQTRRLYRFAVRIICFAFGQLYGRFYFIYTQFKRCILVKNLRRLCAAMHTEYWNYFQ